MNSWRVEQALLQRRMAKGFTLIEVMVAVAILALALPAMLYALSNQLENTGYLRDKLFAQWAAENALAEIRFANRRSGNIAKSQQGEEQIAGRTWYWRSEAKAFPQEEFKDIIGVQISVFLSKENRDQQAITTLTGIVRRFDTAPQSRPAFAEPPTASTTPANNQHSSNADEPAQNTESN